MRVARGFGRERELDRCRRGGKIFPATYCFFAEVVYGAVQALPPCGGMAVGGVWVLWEGNLSPGSTLRHQIPTLSRHYPDASTLRHQCQPTLGPTLRHQCQASVKPSRQWTSSYSVKQCQWCQDKTDTPTLDTSDTPDTPDTPTLHTSDTPDTPDTPTLQASMLTRGTHTQQRPTQDKTHRHAIESTWCHHPLIILPPIIPRAVLRPQSVAVRLKAAR